MAKAAINKKTLFHQQITLKFKEETIKVVQLEVWLCVVLKRGHFRK
jgi:hypothetical protein